SGIRFRRVEQFCLCFLLAPCPLPSALHRPLPYASLVLRSASEDRRMSRRLLAAAFAGVVLVSLTPDRADARPIALEDYYRLVNVQSPAMSPDGKWIAFVRTAIVEADNRRIGELWIVAADGSAQPRRISDPALNASAPHWSPDGQLLAFTGGRGAATPPEDESETIWFLKSDRLDEAAFHINGVGGPPVFRPETK